MYHRLLGKTGIEVSEIGFGAWGMGGPVEDAASIRTMERALELGVNFLGTAEVYSKALARRRVHVRTGDSRDWVEHWTGPCHHACPGRTDTLLVAHLAAQADVEQPRWVAVMDLLQEAR